MKMLSKIKSVSLDDVRKEIEKHEAGLNNFKTLWTLRNRKIIKWYLLSKKVRLVVLFQEKKSNYVPFYVARKETRDWFNISKYSLDDLDAKLDSILIDLESWRFEIL